MPTPAIFLFSSELSEFLRENFQKDSVPSMVSDEALRWEGTGRNKRNGDWQFGSVRSN